MIRDIGDGYVVQEDLKTDEVHHVSRTGIGHCEDT